MIHVDARHTRYAQVAKRAASAVSRSTASPLLLWLAGVMVFVSPFNGAVSFGPLGELGHEAYALVALAALPILLMDLAKGRAVALERRIIVAAVVLFLVAMSSLLLNFGAVLSARQKGEWGLVRLFTSVSVLMFGFYCSVLIHAAASVDFRRYFLKPLLATTVIACAVGFVELASWYASPIYNVYRAVSSTVLHASTGRGQFVLGRIQSVSFEASAFGALVIFVLPWCYSYVLEKGLRRAWPIALATAGIVFLSACSGRTSIAGVAGVTLVYAVVTAMSRLQRGTGAAPMLSTAMFLAGILPVAGIIVFTDQIVQFIQASHSPSNASRFGTVSIMIRLFQAHPLLGVGPGQYGFYARDMIESWAYNWEFERWLGNPSASFFPSFSVYARFAGEWGAIGFGIWTLFVASLTSGAAMTWQKVKAAGVIPRYGVAVITSLFGVVLVGWSSGSFKVFNLWAAIAMATVYIAAPLRVEREGD
ncbi:MAG: hypothetical protein QM608_08790 [Caulobacter sp.]